MDIVVTHCSSVAQILGDLEVKGHGEHHLGKSQSKFEGLTGGLETHSELRSTL